MTKKSPTCGSGSAQLEIKTTPPRGRAGHADAPVPPSLISRVIKCAGRVFITLIVAALDFHVLVRQ